MLKTSTVSHKHNLPKTDRVQSLSVEAFDRFSKEELLAVLLFMHRMLDPDKRRDLERIGAELPALLSHDAHGHDATTHPNEKGELLGEYRSKDKKVYQVLSYFFSCLSKARTPDNAAQASRLPAANHSGHLSPRELTVLHWMKEGKTNWEIARILGLSERTIRFHAGGIFEKLDVTSRTQAVARALGEGLIAS